MERLMTILDDRAAELSALDRNERRALSGFARSPRRVERGSII
jgi:hypothetical protein